MGNTHASTGLKIHPAYTDSMPNKSHDMGIDIVNNNTSKPLKQAIKARNENLTEEKRMHDDMISHSDYLSGRYRHIPWKMTRVYMSKYSFHWCGYVLYDGDLTDAETDAIGRATHGGLTTHMGFDCAHNTDYTALWTRGVYRNHDYVLTCIKNMIDIVLETKAFDITKCS
jgi:hypothetical protein